MFEVLTLSKDEVESLLTPQDVIDAVEGAFRAHGEHKTILPVHGEATVTFNPTGKESFEADWGVKSAYIQGSEHIEFKLTCGYFHNPSRFNLPSGLGTIALFNVWTGAPVAIMDGVYITDSRTGAAGAVAAKWLARRDSRRVAIFGAGVQARMQLEYLTKVMKIEEVKVYNRTKVKADVYAAEMASKLNLKLESVDSPENAANSADIIVATTAAKSPYIMSTFVGSGAHVNSIGADVKGKQEVDTEVYRKAKVIVDSLHVALSKGYLQESDVYSELGEVVTGRKKGRENSDEITVFDSTGLGIQDAATADLVYGRALEKGFGRKVSL